MEEGKRWVDTTTGIVAVNGVVVAVVSSVVTWLINNAATLPWLAILGVFAGIAAITFLILSIAHSGLRNIVWIRPVRFFRSIRLTTFSRIEKDRKASEKKGYKLATEHQRPVLEENQQRIVQLKTQLQDVLRKTEAKTEENEALELQAAKLLSENLQLTKEIAKLTEEKEHPRQESAYIGLPTPYPRWTLACITKEPFGTKYRLRNNIPGSVAYNVRLDVKYGFGNFELNSAAFWQDLSGESEGEFTGTFFDESEGTTLRLSWIDENHEDHQKDFRLAALNPIPEF